jgi:hypothetical protein
MSALGHAPQLTNVAVGPRRVDHDQVGETATKAVHKRKHMIVHQLEVAGQRRRRYRCVMVERRSSGSHLGQHVSADRRVMCVADDAAAEDKACQRVGESEASGLTEHGRVELE